MTMPAHRRLERAASAALAVAMLVPASSAFAQTEPTRDTGDPVIAAPQSYRLRARVSLAPDGGTTAALTLAQAIRQVRSKACRRTASILWDHVPRRSAVRITLFRREGTPDAMRSDVPDTSCQRPRERRSAFRLRTRVGYPTASGRVVRGPTSLRYAVRILTERANELADEVVQQGTTPTLVLRLGSRGKSVRGMIVGLSRRYGLATSKALSVARCESRFRPRARSAYYGGVYQQAFRYWSYRARRFGHPGESIFDPYANIDVSLRMARAHGWGHWGCA
jgi:soluble lytic murein transglycosylase-like protein